MTDTMRGNPKFEYRNPKEARISKFDRFKQSSGSGSLLCSANFGSLRRRPVSNFAHSNFEFVSDFELRHSDLADDERLTPGSFA